MVEQLMDKTSQVEPLLVQLLVDRLGQTLRAQPFVQVHRGVG